MNYSSNVIFKEGYTVIQTVYASQIYGTFFGVFAEFHVKNIPNNSTEKLLTKVIFHLINYKGILNVELLENFEKPIRISGGSIAGYEFELKIQHTSDSETYQNAIPLDLASKYPTIGGVKFKEGDFFITKRKTIPLAGEGSDTNDTQNAFVNGVFDSEFFIRDGAFGIPKNQINYRSESHQMISPPGNLGSTSCTPSNNRIRFEI